MAAKRVAPEGGWCVSSWGVVWEYHAVWFEEAFDQPDNTGGRGAWKYLPKDGSDSPRCQACPFPSKTRGAAIEAHRLHIANRKDSILKRIQQSEDDQKRLRKDLMDHADKHRQFLRQGPEDLLYSAGARCHCGAGLAYWKNADLREIDESQWLCSELLLAGKRWEPGHTEPRPFMFWKIKSEGQPSAQGQTTRPLAGPLAAAGDAGSGSAGPKPSAG